MFLDIFVLVLFVLIVQTAVGVLQGLNERLDVWAMARRGRVLGAAEHAGVSTLVLLGTVALSTIGLVTLVASGYGLLSLVFVATFTIPVFTVGVWRLLAKPTAALPEKE